MPVSLPIGDWQYYSHDNFRSKLNASFHTGSINIWLIWIIIVYCALLGIIRLVAYIQLRSNGIQNQDIIWRGGKFLKYVKIKRTAHLNFQNLYRSNFYPQLRNNEWFLEMIKNTKIDCLSTLNDIKELIFRTVT